MTSSISKSFLSLMACCDVGLLTTDRGSGEVAAVNVSVDAAVEVEEVEILGLEGRPRPRGALPPFCCARGVCWLIEPLDAASSRRLSASVRAMIKPLEFKCGVVVVEDIVVVGDKWWRKNWFIDATLDIRLGSSGANRQPSVDTS